MRIPELNIVAIWQPIPDKGMNVRIYKQYKYLENGKQKEASDKNPIYRYAKNFKHGNFSYSLLIVSHEADEKLIDKVFKDISKSLTDDDKKHITTGADTLRYAEANHANA